MPLDKSTVNTILNPRTSTYGPWLCADGDDIRAAATGTVHAHWAEGSIDASEAYDISNALAALSNLEVITSPVGARVDLDILHGNEGGTEVQVMVFIGDHILVQSATDLYVLVSADLKEDDQDPGTTRLVYAITSTLEAANRMLDRFFTDFEPRN